MTFEIKAEETAGEDTPKFQDFQSIPRLYRDIVITEKLDGTNAQIHITDDFRMFVGSRSRWITPENDNMGFARWVREHRDELMQLGAGSHFGEWWGAGIQRRYGLDHKRFSLFNVGRWAEVGTNLAPEDTRAIAPACCYVVPVLWRGPFSTPSVQMVLDLLRSNGSVAAEGFLNPEGVVVYHEKARVLFKATLDGDGHKSIKGLL